MTFAATAGTHGEFDWYTFDETTRVAAGPPSPDTSVSLLPAPVRFSGMPDPRWWNFEDARFNWSDVDTDRRDLARLLVIDFMLVQGTDWYVIPLSHPVGELVSVKQLLIRDVFGGYTLVNRTDRDASSWTMFSTTGAQGDYFVLPPSGLRATGRRAGAGRGAVRSGRAGEPGLGHRDDHRGRYRRPRSGRERGVDTPSGAPHAADTEAPLRYQLQTEVPVNWIPFIPVQIDATHRAIALQRAAMQRYVDGTLEAVQPVGRVLNPTGLPKPEQYVLREEEVPRSGTRVLRGAHRTRWVDGSTHLWTARRRRAGLGEASSGLRYDIADRTET